MMEIQIEGSFSDPTRVSKITAVDINLISRLKRLPMFLRAMKTLMQYNLRNNFIESTIAGKFVKILLASCEPFILAFVIDRKGEGFATKKRRIC